MVDLLSKINKVAEGRKYIKYGSITGGRVVPNITSSYIRRNSVSNFTSFKILARKLCSISTEPRKVEGLYFKQRDFLGTMWLFYNIQSKANIHGKTYIVYLVRSPSSDWANLLKNSRHVNALLHVMVFKIYLEIVREEFLPLSSDLVNIWRSDYHLF